MGLPAARIGDMTVHGGSIVAGEPTVMIGNKPAARVMDFHACPMQTPAVVPIPHVGGPIIMGAWTTLVGFMPQSRISDMAICFGPPDMIAQGEYTVLVGMVGGMGGLGAMMGAAMGALGKIMNGGFPKAVQMPDGSIVTQYSKNITIEGTPEYQAKVVRDLDKIKETESGKKLLDSLEESGKKTRIHKTDPGEGNAAWTDPGPPTGTEGYQNADGTPGEKADTQVWYDPDKTKLSGPPGSPYNDAEWAKEGNRPADVGLFHELVHCDDMQHGKMDSSQGTNTGAKAGTPIENSELRAAGLPPYDKEEYSENTYRKEKKLPQRDFY